MGEQVPTERRVSQGSGSVVFTPMELLSGQDRFVPSLRTIDSRTKNRNIENLRVNVPPPSTPFPVLAHSPSPTNDSSPSIATSRTVLPSTRPNMSGKLSLTRIMSPVAKPSKYSEFGSELTLSPSTSVSTSASKLTKDTKEEKTRKAEAKKMKKAEQKAKVERLAEELKERQRRKALARDRGSVHSNRSGGRGGRRHWDDDIAMYNGLGNAV